MGLSYDEVEALRARYPDRLQTQSKIAVQQHQKQTLRRFYEFGAVWGSFVGLLPLSTFYLVSTLRRGAGWHASISVWAPSRRRKSAVFLANWVFGWGLAAVSYYMHERLEDVEAGVWAIQATHLGNFKPQTNSFLDRFFTREELTQYSTVKERMRALKEWQDDNASSS